MKKYIQYTHEAIYHYSHDPVGDEKTVWLILHGYGQLADFFLKKFRVFFDPSKLIIAPEGSNHYYRQGFSGQVGAIWMTKHERETAIQNCNNYLNAVVTDLGSKFDRMPELNILAFSQGTAIASRWLSQSSYKVNKLVLWGGGFAHDLDWDITRAKLIESQVILAWGDQDSFLTEERLREQNNFLENLHLPNLQWKKYQGGHDLEENLLEEIFS